MPTSVFYYPISVYTNTNARTVQAGTVQQLPASGNAGDCCILFNSSLKPNGLYVWSGAGWKFELSEEVVSASSIFRRALRVYVAPLFNSTVAGDLFKNGIKVGQTITAGTDVWVNVLDAATPAQPTVAPGSITRLPIAIGDDGNGIYLETSSSTGMPSPAMVLVRGTTKMWITEDGVTIEGNVAARVSTDEPVPVVPKLGVSRIQVIGTTDTGGVNMSADGGFTWVLYPPNTLPIIYVVDNGVSNIAQCAVGQTLTIQINLGLSTPPEDVVITANLANQGCTIVDQGVSTGDPNVYGTGRTFNLTPTATGCDAVVTLTATVASVVTTLDLHFSIKTS